MKNNLPGKLQNDWRPGQAEIHSTGTSNQEQGLVIQQPTKQQVVNLLKNKPTLYWESINPKTALEVFNATASPSIIEMEIELGAIVLRAHMVKWFNSFIQFYSTNGTMNDLQVADTINLVIEEYPHYKQEDFKLFFKMAKKGMFGQVFGRMDGEVILSWFKAYDKHRDTMAQNESIKEAERFKKLSQEDNPTGITYEEYLQLKKSKK